MLTPRRPPPEDYYQRNCITLCEYVRVHCGDLLSALEAQQLDDFLGASSDSQRLFARFLTRKAGYLRVDSFNYAEVGDVQNALLELTELNLIQWEAHACGDQLISQLRKAELADVLCHQDEAARRTLNKRSKSDLVQLMLSGRSDEQAKRLVTTKCRFVRVARADVWSGFLDLYFGENRQDWSAFVLRDLGMIRYESVPTSARAFADRSARRSSLRVRQLSQWSRRLDEVPQILDELVDALVETSGDRFVLRRRDRALLRIARWQERQNDPEGAIVTYKHVARHPARERRVRILTRLARDTEAELVVNQIKAQPYSQEESQFMERFGKRGGGFQPETMLIEVEELDGGLSIEQFALKTLKENRLIEAGWHVENSLFRSLTGLLYWDAIFAGVPGAFTNPFQSAPNDLWMEDFAFERAAEIRKIEAAVSADGALSAHLNRVIDTKLGVALRNVVH